MGKTFENWLVVSDIDGTLNNSSRKLPPRNFEAVEKFVSLGGHFTLGSGRPVSSLARHYPKIHCNEPAIVLNGAGIYDFNKNEMIWKREIGEEGQNFVREVRKKFPLIEVGIFFQDYAYIVKAGVASLGQCYFDKTEHEVAKLENIPTKGWYKVIFWANPVTLQSLIRYAAKRYPDKSKLNFMKSSIWSFEMLDGNTHKGTAVMALADMLGVEKSHVAAIGDYYNDWDMLCTVGLPACAGQAPKKMKMICDYVACHCNDGCVGDLLEHIMKIEENR